MKRTIKVLGLAMVAVLALSAVIASAASATTTFTAEKEANLSVSSNETQVFTYTAGGAQVKCTGVQVEGKAKTSSTAISVTPTYSGCTGPGGLAAHVSFNGGCFEEFTANGTVHLCPTGGTVTIVVTGLCTYHFSAQTVTTIDYEHTGSGTTTEVRVKPTVTNTISATNTNPGFLCGAESSTTGSYTGSVTITGSSGGTHVPLTLD